MIRQVLVICTVFLLISESNAQIIKPDTTDLTFTGTKISPYSLEYDTTGSFTLSGYIDAYYAGYTDSAGAGGYQKFPTAAPRNNQFGLNIVQIGMKYHSNRFRGLATLFFGDTPRSAWSPNFNMIQEAHLGFRIIDRFWLDAGFFRTHIGLESIQPRENIAMSLATTTYFEPYYLSGAKLTYEYSEKWMFQLNAFNGFNNFVDNNTGKAFGASVAWTPNEKLSATLSTIVSDESADEYPLNQTRDYTNFIAVYQTRRMTIGLEGNYGIQTNSQLSDSSATATMFSTLLALKYRFTPNWATYTRFEYFTDPNEMLTGPVINEYHTLTGLDITGVTLGFEYKPIPNSYFRIEGRYLKTLGEDEHIFYYDNTSTNERYELIAGIGVWF